MEDCLTLYTWQSPDWDITIDKRDLSKGGLRWGAEWEKLIVAYNALEQRIGASNFIWCSANYENWKQTDISRLWVLKTPVTSIFKFIDDTIWERIKEEPMKSYLWDSLIIEKTAGITIINDNKSDTISLLLLVPLSTSIQVLDKERFNTGPYSIPNAEFEDLPDSEEEAKRCHEQKYDYQPKARNKAKRSKLRRQ